MRASRLTRGSVAEGQRHTPYVEQAWLPLTLALSPRRDGESGTCGGRINMTRIVITEFLETDAVDELKRRGYDVHYDSTLWTKRAELEKLVRDLPGLIVRNRTPVDQALLELAPKLKVVGRLGVGLDNIDVKACEARGVEVCSARGANATSVVRVCHRHGHDPAARPRLPRHAPPGGRRVAARGAGPRRRAGRQDARRHRPRLDRQHQRPQGPRARHARHRQRSLPARRQRELEPGARRYRSTSCWRGPTSSPSTARSIPRRAA